MHFNPSQQPYFMLSAIIHFLENTPSLYFARVNMAGVYTYVNNLYKQDFKHIYKNFVGEIAAQSVHTDDIEICNEAGMLCLNNPEKVISVDFRKAGHDGKDFYIRWNLFAIKDEAGTITEIGFVGFNITEHFEEKSEHKTTLQKLQAALNNSEESFYFLDKNMRVLSFNVGAKNATHLLYDKEMHEGYDFKQSLLPGTEASFYKQFESALQGIESSEENEITFPTGHNVWYKLSMKPAHDENGNIIGVALSYINIDNYKKSSIRLKEIAWHQSHKVRKPLSNILGLVNLLKDAELQEKDKEILHLLENSAKELDDIIKDIVTKTLI